MKKITIVWTIILVVVVAGLTIIGFNMKEKNVENILEKALQTQCEKYLGLYPGLYPNLGDSIKVTYSELVDKGYDAELGENCDGYVIVKNTNMGFTYESFVNCPDYVTEGYDK